MLMLRLAWRNIWRQPRRTWLTLAAIIFSNMILVLMISMQNGMYRLMIDNTLRLGSGHYQVQAEGYLERPAMRKTVAGGTVLARELRERFGDVATARASSFALLSSEQRTYGAQVIGVEPGHEPLLSSLPGLTAEGRYLQPDDVRSVVIGRVLAKNLKVAVGDELTLLGSGKDGSIAADIVDIVGLFQTGNTDIDRLLVHMPLAAFQQVFTMQDDVHAVIITTDSIDNTAQLLGSYQPPDGTVLLDWDRLEPGLMQAIKADIGSASIIYLVLVMLCGFSVLNTVLMAVLERTREFGIFMALGLRPTQLAKMIFLEAAMLAFIGLVLGALLGGLVTLYFEIYGMYIPGYEEMAARFNLPARMHPDVDLLTLVLGPVFVYLSAILASVYPALKIIALKPLDAMHARGT